MKHAHTYSFFLSTLFWLFLFFSFSGNAQVTFTVTNTDNAGAGSLRDAILSANATTDYDTIRFAIPGAGPHTITLDSTNSTADELTITWPVLIDGHSQGGSGYTGLPLIQIDCNNMTANTQIDAFHLDEETDGSIIRGLNIIHQYGAAIVIDTAARECIVEDCTFGVDLDGTTIMPSGFGQQGAITVFGRKAIIRRCVVSGQNTNGIMLIDEADSSLIYSNFIGTDYTGTTAVPNSLNGVFLLNYLKLVDIDSNVISGNLQSGILLDGSETAHPTAIKINRNRIGTDAYGTTSIPNQVGIHFSTADSSHIGKFSADGRNIISGNLGDGIILNAGTFNFVIYNYIGTDSSGKAPLGNGLNGIAVYSTDAGPSINHLIGGNTNRVPNVIAFNGHHGVTVYNGSSNVTDSIAIRGNSIHSNGGLGINLSSDDIPTVNDIDDLDSGVNELINFPEITSVINLASGNTVINYDLDVPAGFYFIEFFINPTGSDISLYGEGEQSIYIHLINPTANGLHSYSVSVPGLDTVIQNHPMSAATHRCKNIICVFFSSSSEFSLAYSNYLHVDFISFEANKLSQDKVELSWSITDDSEVQLFEIYRMLDDENDFKKIGSLTKDQYDENQNSFRYIDLTKGFSGQAYYKIRHIDTDLKTADSDIKSIMFHQVNTKAIQVYPNPSKDFITLLHRNADEAIRYTLLNAVGNEILSGSVFPGEQIDVQALRPGIYYIQASNSINEFNSKILLLD